MDRVIIPFLLLLLLLLLPPSLPKI